MYSVELLLSSAISLFRSGQLNGVEHSGKIWHSKTGFSFSCLCPYLFKGASFEKGFEQSSVVGRLLGAVMSHLQGLSVRLFTSFDLIS